MVPVATSLGRGSPERAGGCLPPADSKDRHSPAAGRRHTIVHAGDTPVLPGPRPDAHRDACGPRARVAVLSQHWFISSVQTIVPSHVEARRFAGDASSFEASPCRPWPPSPVCRSASVGPSRPMAHRRRSSTPRKTASRGRCSTRTTKEGSRSSARTRKKCGTTTGLSRPTLKILPGSAFPARSA